MSNSQIGIVLRALLGSYNKLATERNAALRDGMPRMAGCLTLEMFELEEVINALPGSVR